MKSKLIKYEIVTTIKYEIGISEAELNERYNGDVEEAINQISKFGQVKDLIEEHKLIEVKDINN